ncbi:hypothetical protein HO173_002559 [Letharia columbiana]|uniref:ATPase AAA-type core domain-containing protein n=1 Tax=Letharia columbiana TaxID=112416 RepID=A0A8H6G2P3_9LECA|nr:uncharacterized protein HO173_002559 [Letharia columbiana]KAF6239297.1 hypothetical protein HO173_002559 [Letharia columbiana]
MHTRPSTMPLRPSTSTSAVTSNSSRDGVYKEFYQNSTAPRIKSDVVLVEALRKQYPSLHVTVVPSYQCNFLVYAATGHASATPIDAENASTENLKHRQYTAPAKRMDGGSGFLYDSVQFGKWMYKWESKEYILYYIVGSDGPYDSPMNYLLGSTPMVNDELMLAACRWQNSIRKSVLVFDGGYWQYSSELWQSIQKANWEDVILDAEMKKNIIGEVTKFFNSKDRYKKLRVPWKRGVIFHGPPGNGKTISIKAMMHSLYDRDDPIPTLYVRSLASYGGPEHAISLIFRKARQMASCFLVFEDLDSIVSDAVRSYFLNEVDGLQNNDGIMMVGSTNHLERLDPGISKRPSRFDRKYLFPDPNMEERVKYCEFWRKKLDSNEDVEFPKALCEAIAGITQGFSFAYIQEAFVAALLVIANGDAGEEIKGDGPFGKEYEYKRCVCKKSDFEMMVRSKVEDEKHLEKYLLWREIKKVIKTLREELEMEKGVGGLACGSDCEKIGT